MSICIETMWNKLWKEEEFQHRQNDVGTKFAIQVMWNGISVLVWWKIVSITLIFQQFSKVCWE